MIDSLKSHMYWVTLGKATRIDQSHTGSGPCQISLVLSSVSGLPDALLLQDLDMVTSPLLFTYSSPAHTQFKPFFFFFPPPKSFFNVAFIVSRTLYTPGYTLSQHFFPWILFTIESK